MHEVLVNRLGGLSLPRKSVVRLTDRPDMTLDVYRGRKTTMQQQQQHKILFNSHSVVGVGRSSFVSMRFCWQDHFVAAEEAKGEGWAPPFISCAQDTVGLLTSIASTAIRLWKTFTFLIGLVEHLNV